MRKKILIIEDEQRLNRAIGQYLHEQGYIVVSAFNGPEGLEAFDSTMDLVIVDVMLPIIDGYTVCQTIRRQSDVHIIMLTALREERDKLQGYEAGVDEYVTKPFSLDVLHAKIRAILSRSRGIQKECDDVDFKLDREACKLYINQDEVYITPKEFKMLAYFMDNQGVVLTRDQILNHIWGYDFYGNTRVVDTHVKNLRKKLGEKAKTIETVKGIGYRFEAKNEN